MPQQIYRCPDHGEFEVSYNILTTVRQIVICTHGMNTKRRCGLAGVWIPQVVSFSISGGTGAQRNPR